MKIHESVVIALIFVLLIGCSNLAYAATIDVTVTVPVEKPDLTLSPEDIAFDPAYPLTGDAVTITASVHNIGEVSVVNIPVTFYVDGARIATQTATIPSETTATVSTSWAATTVGAHLVTVKVDEEDLMDEHDEANNYARKSIKVTKPLALAIVATPEIIEVNGAYLSTVTAFVTDETGLGMAGVEVSFATTLGTVNPDHATTDSNGIATTTLTASTSAGTEVVTGTAMVNGTHVEDTATVVFDKSSSAETNNTISNTTITIEGTNISISGADVTIENGVITINTTLENAMLIADYATAGTVISIALESGALEITLAEDSIAIGTTVSGTISKIKLNTPADEYITSIPEVGTASVDLDVEFQGAFTPHNLVLETTLREDYEDLPIPAPCDLKDTLAAYFGVDTMAIENNTPILVYAELSATNLTADDVTGVPMTITVNKEWFNTVAEGDPGKVTMFKLNETTGAVESTITMTSASYTVNDGTITFFATFDHFSVYAIIAQPSAAGPSGPGGGGTGNGAARRPGEITIPITNPGINIFNFEYLGLEITKIVIDLESTAFNAKVTVQPADKPEIIPDPTGIANCYFDLSTTVEPENIRSTRIYFKVSQSWIATTGINSDTLEMQRYAPAKGWDALATTKISNDDNYSYFYAETSAFSLFAITGEQSATGIVTATPTPVSVPSTPPAATATPTAPPTSTPSAWIPTIGVVGIVVAIVASAMIRSSIRFARKRRKG
jgi:PGF-pre-PGF domain-containing protein